MLDDALKYGARGYRVFPVQSTKGGRCMCPRGADCDAPGKHPRIKAWQDEASCDETQIRAWWTKWPDANIGLKVPSGIAVLDVDPRNGGDTSYEQMLMEFGRLPDGPTQDTGGGGLHIWFRLPEGAGPPQKDTVAGCYRPGLEWRTDVHYVIVAPSKHVSGGAYEWQVDAELGEAEIPLVPSWLTDNPKANRQVPNVSEAGLVKVRTGQRNTYLTSIAGALRRKGCNLATIEAALLAENDATCVPPLRSDEVRAIATSVSRYAPSDPPAVEKEAQTIFPPSGDFGECLDQVEAFVRRYVVLPSEAESVALTLWIAHTYMIDQAETSPYLAITSAEKRCGKSRLLDVLELLVARPWKATLPTEAVMFRKISMDHPTLLLDELDAVFGPAVKGDYEGLRALLNAGNRRGTRVPRVQAHGKKLELVEFDVFCAKALAGIGKLPGTVADRSIPIRLQRRKKSEQVERLKARMAAALAAPILAELEAHARTIELPLDVDIPDALGDRAADGWEPLLAIAGQAGSHWLERARKAAVALSGSTEDDDSVGVRLLLALRAVFESRDGVWASTSLIERLNEDEESPWREFGKDGLKAPALARLLKPFGIQSKNHRDGARVAKSYDSADFADAFARFLPSKDVRYSATGECAESGSTGGDVAA